MSHPIRASVPSRINVIHTYHKFVLTLNNCDAEVGLGLTVL